MHGIKIVASEGLLRRLTIVIVVICTCICRLSKTSRSVRFYHLSVSNERFSSPYKTLDEASGLQCSAICVEEEECLALNHNAAIGRCELIDLSGLQQGKQITEDSSWTVYDKDDCIISPCKNGGECSNTVDGYTCSCIYPWIGEACQITYVCYGYSPEEEELMSAGTSQLNVCEMVPGRKFTEGIDSLAPGCGNCWCCTEVLT